MAGAKPRLGRGLDSLIPAPRPEQGTKSPQQLPIEALQPRRDQPRRYFEDAALEELADSLRHFGVLEPILVRRGEGNKEQAAYEIIAGERRWRAAQRAGLKEVPVRLLEMSDQKSYEAALVENLQREDLNPVESAQAFQRLIEDYGHSQESLAQLLGRDRSTVANSLRLLKLPPEVLQLIERGELSEGHGRALLAAGHADRIRQLAQRVIQYKLSVRATEKLAKAEAAQAQSRSPKEKNANLRDLEERLGRALSARVSVEDKKGKGKIVLYYEDLDALDALLDKLMA